MAYYGGRGTTVKQQNLISAGFGELSVGELPGVGQATEQLFNQDGIYQASQVFGQWLFLNQSTTAFSDWLGNYRVYANHKQRILETFREKWNVLRNS